MSIRELLFGRDSGIVARDEELAKLRRDLDRALCELQDVKEACSSLMRAYTDLARVVVFCRTALEESFCSHESPPVEQSEEEAFDALIREAVEGSKDKKDLN